MTSFWIQTPSDDVLSEMRAWAQVGKNLYAALRHHLLIVTQRDSETKNGPPSVQMDWPVGAKFTLSEELATITKFTYGVQESVTSAVTTKLSQEVMSKVGWSAGASPTELKATVSSELSAKLGAELIESLQGGLSTNRSYEIQVSSKKVQSLVFTVAQDATTKPIFIYPKLHQVIWKVYLYQTDILQLEYKRNRFWFDLRETIRKGTVVFREPLFSITFFEPEMELSIAFDKYTPQVTDGTSTSTAALEGKSPLARPPELESLEELARLAFPASRREKEVVKRRQPLPSPIAAKRVPAKKAALAAARRTATKKTAAKRTAAKKTAGRKAAAKKTTRV